jgi:hypothetical protein
LPFPISWKDPVTALVVNSCPIVQEEFLGHKLRVTHLAPGNYTLKIDDESIATVSAGDLALGIDLAKLDTPMSRQAAEVHVLTVKRTYLMWSLWRQVEVGLPFLDGKEKDDVAASTHRLEDRLIQRQHEMARPKPHRFAIVPVQ